MRNSVFFLSLSLSFEFDFNLKAVSFLPPPPPPPRLISHFSLPASRPVLPLIFRGVRVTPQPGVCWMRREVISRQVKQGPPKTEPETVRLRRQSKSTGNESSPLRSHEILCEICVKIAKYYYSFDKTDFKYYFKKYLEFLMVLNCDTNYQNAQIRPCLVVVHITTYNYPKTQRFFATFAKHPMAPRTVGVFFYSESPHRK